MAVTHIVLCRRGHSDHHMALGYSFPQCCFLGHGDGDRQVANPRPQHWWVWECYVNVVTILGKIWLPDGLEEKQREQILEHCAIRVIMNKTSVLAYAHLIDNPACDAHAIKNSHIDNCGHSPIVDGLRAVRPHVWTLSQVNVAGRQAGRKDGGVSLNCWPILP